MLTQRVPSERKGIKDERQEKGLFEYELDHNCSYGICANAACSFFMHCIRSPALQQRIQKLRTVLHMRMRRWNSRSEWITVCILQL